MKHQFEFNLNSIELSFVACVFSGCLLVKEKRYAEACKKFNAAMNVKGYQPHLSYNIALCHYYMKQYALALKNIADIIEKGIR